MTLQTASSDVSEQVAELAGELDQDQPGWAGADRVNLDTLRMDSAILCVLGQVYADDGRRNYLSGWSYGLKRLRMLFGPSEGGRAAVTKDYKELWTEQIMRRRGTPAEAPASAAEVDLPKMARYTRMQNGEKI